MFENIPAELRALPQWVCAGSNKVPINPSTGKNADPTDPATGVTFAEAVQAGMQNIGFILGANDPYTIVDLDDPFERTFKGVKSKIVEGDPDYKEAVERAERHSKIYESFNTYAELSQSGRGVHIVMRGAIPCGVRRDKVEIYTTDRYMIFTGNVLRNAPVSDCQELLDGMFSQMGKLTNEAGELIEEESTADDAVLWERARRASNGEKFTRLCEGEWGEGTAYPSQSEADYALLSMLAFYTRSNEQVRRMFRETALGQRDKAKRNDTYINRSLRRIRSREAPLVDFSKVLGMSEAEECRQSPFPIEQVENPQAPFPLQHLGETLEPMGRAICATERTPEALTGCCLLAILSASIGSGLQVQSGPNRTTRGNLYILASAESGSGKSETFRHMVRPFQEFEAETIREWEQKDQPELLADKDLLEIEMATLKRKLGSNSAQNRNDVRKQMQDLKAKLQTVEKALRAPAFSCEDVSTERLAALLADNGEQLASLSADARGAVDNLMGRYTKGSATDESIYLKAYSGDAHRVDRISRAPVVLNRPCLTVLWLVQPDKLELLLGSQSLTDGGLLPRFLACHTQCEPQEIGEDTPEIPVSVESAYRDLIRDLLTLYRLAECPATVQPTDEARRIMCEHFNSIVQRRKQGGDLRDISSYASRWNENAWRIAVCLHAAKHGKDAASNSLDLETAQRAIAIADWFAGQQLYILSAGREMARQTAQEKVLLLLAKTPSGITARNVHRARIKQDTESCRALLAEMEEAGLLVGRDTTPKGGGHTTRIYARR